MWPPTHVAVGYLLYSLFGRVADEAPRRGPIAALVAGTLVSDVVDKPLNWWYAAPSGRTVAHSLLLAVPVVAAAWALGRRYGRRESAVAFGIGYATHLVADLLWPLLAGDVRELGFVLWPITESPPYEGQKTLSFGVVELSTLWIELVLIVVAIGVWYADGLPGLSRPRQE